MQLLKCLLKGNGVKVKEKQLTELLVFIRRHCHWFLATPHIQLKLKIRKQFMRALRRAYQKGRPIPSKIWSFCNLASKALEPLQSEESLKAVSEVKQKSKRKDTRARN